MLETEPALIEQYVKTGEARLIYRHLFQLGESSRLLAEASECAGEQGKFWEMRELIYEQQGGLYSATTETLAPLAEELDLDGAQFAQCLDSGQFRQQVEDDYAAAQREGVRSRPVMDINDQRIIGAQPFAQYQQAIEAAK